MAVAADRDAPRVVLSTFLATAAEGDLLALEPYHVAAEIARGARGKALAEAAAAVEEGRKRQDALAVKGLSEIIRALGKDQCDVVAAALLVNRAGWITDLLQYSLFAPEHPAVAEGLAVREALRFALGECGVAVVEMDEKSLRDDASMQLRRSPPEINVQLKDAGATVGKPWRKEQKLACLAAWIAVTAKA